VEVCNASETSEDRVISGTLLLFDDRPTIERFRRICWMLFTKKNQGMALAERPSDRQDCLSHQGSALEALERSARDSKNACPIQTKKEIPQRRRRRGGERKICGTCGRFWEWKI